MTSWFRLSRIVRYIIIGCINAIVSYAIFAVLLLILGENFYQLCITLQWVISSIISYLNQKFFVFCTTGNYIKEYLKCCSTWAVSYVLNLIIIEIFIRFITKNVYVSQFFALLTVAIATYTLFKFFAFKK